jgi:hypothetical protein
VLIRLVRIDDYPLVVDHQHIMLSHPPHIEVTFSSRCRSHLPPMLKKCDILIASPEPDPFDFQV